MKKPVFGSRFSVLGDDRARADRRHALNVTGVWPVTENRGPRPGNHVETPPGTTA